MTALCLSATHSFTRNSCLALKSCSMHFAERFTMRLFLLMVVAVLLAVNSTEARSSKSKTDAEKVENSSESDSDSDISDSGSESSDSGSGDSRSGDSRTGVMYGAYEVTVDKKTAQKIRKILEKKGNGKNSKHGEVKITVWMPAENDCVSKNLFDLKTESESKESRSGSHDEKATTNEESGTEDSENASSTEEKKSGTGDRNGKQ